MECGGHQQSVEDVHGTVTMWVHKFPGHCFHFSVVVSEPAL